MKVHLIKLFTIQRPQEQLRDSFIVPLVRLRTNVFLNQKQHHVFDYLALYMFLCLISAIPTVR